MSIASITCGFGIFVLNIVAAAHEELFGCVPFHYSWNCPTDDLARTLVDCALVLCGAFEIAVGITSTVAASYKLSCCRNSCCGGNGNAQQTLQPVQMSLLPGYVQSPPAYATGQPVGGQFYILPANAIAHSQVMGNQAQQGMGPVVHSQAQPVAPVQLAQYNPDIAAPEPTSGSTEKEA
ncbi:uncharacterized protein [Diadema antillarum]|uniref:uncharacterized protein n=1 Tax=Diadema antillarum TaxID=105358 RepID=UPI003A89E3EA